MDDMAAYLQTLKNIASGLGPQQGFQASLKAFLTLLARRHAFLRPHLVIFDPETRTLRLCVADGEPRSDAVAYEPGVGVTGQVFVSGRPVIVDCLQGHPVFLSKFFARSPEELASLAFICVPILVPEGGDGMAAGDATQVIGVLSVDTPCAPAAVLEQHCRFLEVVAAMIASQAAHLQDDLLRRQHILLSPVSAPASEDGGNAAGFSAPWNGGLVAVSKAMRRVMEQARQAAQGRESVLLTGEPGTGKERLAAFIHSLSSRRDLPLVRFSPVGSLAGADALETAARELFGYRKGAFPGAMQTRKGSFELAHSSTLILEDLDRFPVSLQEGILRVLREREVSRLGGGMPVPVDVRIVCTAVRPLETLVEEGLFLRELYERVSFRTIRLAPLRERREDILPLAQLFLKAASSVTPPGGGGRVERISAPARELLLRYEWPGNIHELIHCLEQAALICDDAVLRAAHLPSVLQTAGQHSDNAALSLADAVEAFERELLCDALQRTCGNMLQAARDLRTSYRIVNYKVKKYGIAPRSFAPARP